MDKAQAEALASKHAALHVPVIRKPAHPAAVSAALADLLKPRAH